MEREFESRVALLLESIGFKIARNTRLVGRSGIFHRPDMIFSAGNKTFLVECKIRFSRDDILSAYGEATDMDVSHIFLVGKEFLSDVGAYPRKFNLTLLHLRDNARSEKNFQGSVSNLVKEILSKEQKIGLPSRGKQELNSLYFAGGKLKELENIISDTKMKMSISLVANNYTRIDVDGSSRYILPLANSAMRKQLIGRIQIPQLPKIEVFLHRIEEDFNAKIVRFGLLTDKAYVVRNIRFVRNAFYPEEIEKILLEEKGTLTSVGFKLRSQETLNLSQSPSLNLKYFGMDPENFFKLRECFERLLFWS